MGLEAKPRSSEIISATTKGIQTVFQRSLAALADVSTGAMMSATTAGRIPMNMAEITRLFFIISGVRKMAIAKIIRKEGRIVPNEATTLPAVPRSLSPTAVAMFTASIPGSDCATARRSRKSSFSIQWYLSTISRSIMEIMAQPPPNVKAPILKKVANSLQKEAVRRSMSLSMFIVIVQESFYPPGYRCVLSPGFSPCVRRGRMSRRVPGRAEWFPFLRMVPRIHR